jgi:hypothetical protein
VDRQTGRLAVGMEQPCHRLSHSPQVHRACTGERPSRRRLKNGMALGRTSYACEELDLRQPAASEPDRRPPSQPPRPARALYGALRTCSGRGKSGESGPGTAPLV